MGVFGDSRWIMMVLFCVIGRVYAGIWEIMRGLLEDVGEVMRVWERLCVFGRGYELFIQKTAGLGGYWVQYW